MAADTIPNPKTQAPTTYKLEGFIYRNPPREGKWTVVHGTKDDPDAIVYLLDADKPGQSIYLLKGDDNARMVGRIFLPTFLFTGGGLFYLTI
jgi:hypothetical protein